LGVIADAPQVEVAASGATPVQFDLYLTAPTISPTVVDYTVVAPDAGDLAASLFGNGATGSITIAAGQTAGHFTLDVPQGALGPTTPSETLKVAISTPGGTPIFVSTAQATVAQPIQGPPPLPVLSDLTTLGTFADNGHGHYTLDLGAIQAGEPLPPLQFALTNTAAAGADNLGGTFSATAVEGFSVAGAALPSPLAPGQTYSGLQVNVNEMKFGANTETVTLHPTDTNATGFNQPLSPVTLDIDYTLEQQSRVYSQAWGDVHIVTYNGLTYNFQAVGEFTLAKSRLPNDQFDIQMRLQPWTAHAVVTVISQVAVSVGGADITFGSQGFDPSRTAVVYDNGTPATLSATDPVISFSDGSKVQQLSSSSWEVIWNTGETATITKTGIFFNILDSVPVGEPGFVAGLQGEDEGQANDFQLNDGQVLPQPLSPSTLYGEYADSWRVSPSTTLFNYGPGKTTADFTDKNFPKDNVPLSSLPQTVLAQAAPMVSGITDPGIKDQAELDFIATGDPNFIMAGQQAADQVFSTTPVTMASPAAPPAMLGVSAAAASLVEAKTGTTAVTFNVYLTSAVGSDTTVAYSVVDPGAGFLGAPQLGGSLPTGSVTIKAGQTTAPVTINVPQGALGTDPNDNLELQITGPNGGPGVFAPTAQTKIVNNTAMHGAPPVVQLTDFNHTGALTYDSTTHTYTLDFGMLPQGAQPPVAVLSLVNGAAAPADDLSGTFTPPLGSGFLVSGNSLPGAIPAGQNYAGLQITGQTQTPGSHTETFSFTAADVNDSGYDAPLPGGNFTLKIVDSIGASAQANLNTPDMIVFPNVRVGTAESRTISVSNTATAPAGDLDVSATASGDATVAGSISLLAPGATDVSSIAVGLNTASLGVKAGMVSLGLASDNGAGTTQPILPGFTINAFGSVYAKATAQITPLNEIVHVHDAGSAALSVGNADPAHPTLDPNGLFTENLIASAGAATGGFTASGTTGEIAKNKSD
ncbi:MAG: choice-of-anchor D domain-containing protein, partial [Alphaproteobacteria bacterium]|nr:choice-of-anchor D domain-containing protein [Alphaproteobacteria bacterium]